MAAVVQNYPQQTGTITMLQTRPSSATGIMSGHSHSHSHSPSPSSQQYMANQQANRNSFHGLAGAVGGQSSYRGISATPVQPYAFTATPTLANGGQWQAYGSLRTTSTPNMPTTQTLGPNMAARPLYQSNGSMTNIPSSAGRPVVMAQGVSRDDSSLPPMSAVAFRQQSAHLAGTSGQPTFAQVASGKAAPDRYRRPSPRTTDSTSGVSPQTQGLGSAVPSGSGMATVVHLYNPRAMSGKVSIPRNSATLASANRPHSAYGYMPGVAADDMQVPRQATEDDLKRFRRRSMASFDATDYPNPMTPQELKLQQAGEAFRAQKNSFSDKDKKPSTSTRVAPVPAADKKTTHTRNGSSESLVSSRSSNSRPSSVSRLNATTIADALSNQTWISASPYCY
ncbi:hypothetical protein BJ170DRAFT_347404 [Xylariales sp. AK1849]|nr:hypothetical protein BJ170DRAFT_347404 [Xylariales sp. AK1849]